MKQILQLNGKMFYNEGYVVGEIILKRYRLAITPVTHLRIARQH
jgi:hypothetical protein